MENRNNNQGRSESKIRFSEEITTWSFAGAILILLVLMLSKMIGY